MIRSDVAFLEKLPLAQCSPDVRGGFVRKVYALVALQLLLTTGIASSIVFVPAVQSWVMAHPEMNYVALILSLVLLCTLSAHKDRYPINLLLLFLFTVVESYLIALVCALTQPVVTIASLAMTITIFGTLSVYMHLSKSDFGAIGPALFAGCAVILALMLVAILFPTYLMQGVVGGAGVLLTSGMILYDTSSLLHHMGPDDAIVAAVQLYLDLVNLFLFLVQLLQSCDSRD